MSNRFVFDDRPVFDVHSQRLYQEKRERDERAVDVVQHRAAYVSCLVSSTRL